MKPIAVIFGANGFLGRYLCRHWARKGYEIVAVARRRDGWSGDGMFLPWDGKNSGPWELALEGASVVVNLAGRSVDCRYDEKNRRELMDSRIDSTRAIGKAIRQCIKPPALWINASTATIYRDARDGPQDEWKGEPGAGFSENLAQKWEESFFRDATPAPVRKVALRMGMVMALEARSALAVMRKMACAGLGGAFAGGGQRVSWVHMDDWLAALDFLTINPLLDGVFNVTAPDSPVQRDFQQVLREQVAMPIGMPATEWMVKLGAWALGTEAELVMRSRWAEPARLLDEGFRFRWPRWEPAVNDLMQRRGVEGFFRQGAARPVGIRAWAQAT